MVTIGLVGAGWWTQAVHAPAFKKAGARIAGVYAGQSARARSLAEAYGVPLFLEYGELLEEVDAVAIATPDTTHVPLALEAVRAGKHVFVEKPLGVNLEETRKLLREIEVRGLVGMTALTARADWGAETALAVVERIGEPLVFRGAFRAAILAEPQGPVTWRGPRETYIKHIHNT
ncbi:Gfo/Idh/MocA family protein, partial [Thermus scotoductus]|uniref:Gfo/Idh/MocA family protein n=1 Tax=Thermus scotoductus TaxID=37636 RepID=UPI001003D63D